MHHVNRHTVEFEEPDLVRTIIRGPIAPDEMVELVGSVLRWSRDRPHVFLIGDLSGFNFEHTSAESRKLAARVSQGIPYRGIGFYGGGTLQRFVMKFIVRALNLLTRRDNPIGLFDTEQEARAWIDERRRVLQAELAGRRERQA